MSRTFQRETIRSTWDELSYRLFPLHWEEFGEDREHIPLSPHRDLYFSLEDKSILHLITMRDNGPIFGYYIGIRDPGLHYKTTVQSRSDIFFIHPRYRDTVGTRGRLLVRLLKEADTLQRDLGVKRWYIGEKLRHPLDVVLPTLGFRPVERVWSKMLG